MPTPKPSTNPLTILITGASIAGPTTAYFLARAFPTASIKILERHPHLRPGGQAIDIRTSGVTVMRKIPGLEPLVRARGSPEEGVAFMRSDGGVWGTLRKSGESERQGLVSEFEILRGELSEILVGLSKEVGVGRVEYLFGESVAFVRQSCDDEGSVEVAYTSGRSAERFNLVVACDGATSRTRALAFSCEVRDHVHPTNIWAAYFSTSRDLLEGGKIAQGLSAVGGRLITLGPDTPTQNRVMLMAVLPSSHTDAITTFREASAQGPEALKQHVAHHFQHAEWKTNLLLEEMHCAEDFYASEIVQVKCPSLYKGRVVLVGDAGYAAGQTGNGTTLALTGAYILAGELSQHPGDLAAGLEAYEQRMRPLIDSMQKVPPFVSTFAAPQTAWGITVRNLAFAALARSGVVGFAQRYLGAAFADSKEFPLPEYSWAQ